MSEAIKVNNELLEPVCSLYNTKGENIGEIHNSMQLNDVRLQIKKEGIAGYTVWFNGRFVKIDKNGNLDTWPDGFYDQTINQLIQLI